MSILNRLERIREFKRLNKSQFEKVLGKSTGYINTLRKNESIPGTDVLIKISDNYPDINFDWLLKGEGEMLKSEEKTGSLVQESSVGYQKIEKETTLLAVRDDIKKDLHELAEGLTKNFEVVSDGIFETLKGQRKILRFIEQLDAERISKATGRLEEYMNGKDQ